jgi:hypothetical protein
MKLFGILYFLYFKVGEAIYIFLITVAVAFLINLIFAVTILRSFKRRSLCIDKRLGLTSNVLNGIK